jgi:hypothetical protein
MRTARPYFAQLKKSISRSSSLWEGLGEGLAVCVTERRIRAGFQPARRLINFVFALARPFPGPSQTEGSKDYFQSDLVQRFLKFVGQSVKKPRRRASSY